MAAIDEKTTEAHCLSSLMKNPRDVFVAISDGLVESDFSEIENAILWSAIKGAAAGDTGDVGAFGVWLWMSQNNRAGRWTQSGIMATENAVPTSAQARQLTAMVTGNARRRRLISELSAAASIASGADASLSFDDLWSEVAPRIEAAQGLTAKAGARTIAEMATEAIRRVENPETVRRIQSGWPGWDNAASPIKSGEMVTIAARPGMGKTALALQLGAHVANKHGTVVFFAMEMSGEELVDRLARHLGAPRARHEKPKLTGAMQEVGKMRLAVYDNRERHTMATIESRTRLHAAMPGGVALVVIDYLQLIEPTDRKVVREQQVAEMSRRCKQLAGMVQAPVIVLAQLNRDIEKHQRAPILSDLRESGAIEQDSDRVWFLWQAPADVMSTESTEIDVTLIQAKCRNGPPDVARKLRFTRPDYTFRQIDSRYRTQ